MRIALIIFMFVFGLSPMVGQKTIQPKQIDFDWKGIVYDKERSLDIRVHSNGAALAFNSGKIRTYYKMSYYQLEVGYLKDPRERRQNKNSSIPSFKNSASFVYGKQNSFFNIRGGYGNKIYLSEKARRKGVAVGWSWEVGPSIGIVKPYYLDLFAPDSQGGILVQQKYSEENADLFLNYNSIFGASPFAKGILESTFIPGGQGKLAAHFSLGAFDKYVRALEAGIMVDVFARKIPIMVETDTIKNKPYFINFFVSLQLGKRE